MDNGPSIFHERWDSNRTHLVGEGRNCCGRSNRAGARERVRGGCIKPDQRRMPPRATGVVGGAAQGRLFLSGVDSLRLGGEGDSRRASFLGYGASRSNAREARPENRLASALEHSPLPVRLGAKALRCRERWCYRAMVPIPPNGLSPPSFSLRPRSRSFFPASQHFPPHLRSSLVLPPASSAPPLYPTTAF